MIAIIPWASASEPDLEVANDNFGDAADERATDKELPPFKVALGEEFGQNYSPNAVNNGKWAVDGGATAL